MKTVKAGLMGAAFVGVVTMAVPAFAQTAPAASKPAPAASSSASGDRDIDVSVGYLYTYRIAPEPGRNFPDGFTATFGKDIGGRLGIVAEFNDAKKLPGIDVTTYQEYDVLGGIRFGSQLSPRVKTFGQVLAGYGHQSTGNSGFALQPGVGIDLMATKSIGARLQVSLNSTDVNSLRENDARFLFGFVFRSAK